MTDQARVGIVMGSDSDWPTMKAAGEALEEFGVAFEADVVSAHRMPDEMLAYGREAAGRGLQVIIAGAGGAAHLPGMLAAVTPLPVIGVPVALSYLDGMDSLLSIVQMPAGVPVATVADRQRPQRRPARRPHPRGVRRGAARRDGGVPGVAARHARTRRARPSAARRTPRRLLARTPTVGANAGVRAAAIPCDRATRRLAGDQAGVLGGEGQQVGGLRGHHRAGLPSPCPAAVSIRASTGASPPWQCCSSAVNLKLCAGTTRSSWSPVSTSVAGYDVPGREVVQRRVGQQHLEHLRVVGDAVVGRPRRADGEQVEAQHVHHTRPPAARRRRTGRAAGSSTAPTSSPPLLPAVEGQLPGVVTPSATRCSADRGEVVEDVLLVREPAAVVPGGAELAAAAEVRDRQHPAGGEPARPLGAVGRAASGSSKPP